MNPLHLLRLALRRHRVPRPMIAWCANIAGDSHDLTAALFTGEVPPAPDGYVFSHYREVALSESVTRDTVAAEVEACAHQEVRPTGGWIDGIEGRRCLTCDGHQTRDVDEPWPEQWSSDGGRRLATSSSGIPWDLVFAMVRPTRIERLRRLRRGYLAPMPVYPMRDAILIAGVTCERCLNVLLHEHGCRADGYREQSAEWHKAGTVCELCEHLPRSRSGRGSCAAAIDEEPAE